MRENGVGNLTLQAVAEKMFVKRPALYRYFISLRELWIAIQIYFQNELMNLMQDIIVKHEGTYIELVFKLYMFYYTHITGDVIRFQVLPQKYSPGAKKLGPIEKAYQPFHFFLYIKYSIKKGIEQKEFKDIDVDFWIYTLWAKVYGLIQATNYFQVNPKEYFNPNYQVSDMTWVKDFKTRKRLFPTISKDQLHDIVEGIIKEAIDRIKI